MYNNYFFKTEAKDVFQGPDGDSSPALELLGEEAGGVDDASLPFSLPDLVSLFSRSPLKPPPLLLPPPLFLSPFASFSLEAGGAADGKDAAGAFPAFPFLSPVPTALAFAASALAAPLLFDDSSDEDDAAAEVGCAPEDSVLKETDDTNLAHEPAPALDPEGDASSLLTFELGALAFLCMSSPAS